MNSCTDACNSLTVFSDISGNLCQVVEGLSLRAVFNRSIRLIEASYTYLISCSEEEGVAVRVGGLLLVDILLSLLHSSLISMVVVDRIGI